MLQGTTPQGLPEKQPAEGQKGRRRGGAGPSGQGGQAGQAEWVARGNSGKGSKHHGVDPVFPFTDTAQLQASFSRAAEPSRRVQILLQCIPPRGASAFGLFKDARERLPCGLLQSKQPTY